MARLWEDIRGQHIGEAIEDWGIEDVLYAKKFLPKNGLNVPLSTLTQKIANPSRRTNIPPALRWKIWERDNFTCRECKSRRFLTIDHIYPVARGGKTIEENLRTLCKQCNSRKHSKVVL